MYIRYLIKDYYSLFLIALHHRINSLMDALCLATDEPTFFSAVWQCVLTSPRGRLPAVCYVFSKLNKKAMAEDQSQYLGGSLPVMVRGREEGRGGEGGG